MGLIGFRQSHEKIVAYQVTLAEVNACGVQAFEDKLRIINTALQLDINDVQACDASIDFIGVSFRGV